MRSIHTRLIKRWESTSPTVNLDGVALSNINFLKPTRCPTIQINSDANYPDIAQTPQTKRLSAMRRPLLWAPATGARDYYTFDQ